MEEVVLSSFVETLNFDPDDVSVDTNCYEAGLTSIDSLRLRDILQTKLAVEDIPFNTILTNPSIEGMSLALQRLTDSNDQEQKIAYNPVVTLGTKGSKQPPGLTILAWERSWSS